METPMPDFSGTPRILPSMREKGKACFTSRSRINGGVVIRRIS
jgi:hypothetical protein